MTALTLNFGYLRTNEGMVVCGEVVSKSISNMKKLRTIVFLQDNLHLRNIQRI